MFNCYAHGWSSLTGPCPLCAASNATVATSSGGLHPGGFAEHYAKIDEYMARNAVAERDSLRRENERLAAAIQRVRALCDDLSESNYGSCVTRERVRAALEGKDDE